MKQAHKKTLMLIFIITIIIIIIIILVYCWLFFRTPCISQNMFFLRTNGALKCANFKANLLKQKCRSNFRKWLRTRLHLLKATFGLPKEYLRCAALVDFVTSPKTWLFWSQDLELNFLDNLTQELFHIEIALQKFWGGQGHLIRSVTVAKKFIFLQLSHE